MALVQSTSEIWAFNKSAALTTVQRMSANLTRIADDLVAATPAVRHPLLPSPGSESATDDVFLEHLPHLRRAARRYLRRPEDVEDIVHDAYIRWRCADKAQILDSKAWLTTTVAHLAIDYLRRSKPAQFVTLNAESFNLDDHPELESEDRELCDWHLTQAAVQSMLEQLSVAERVVFALHDIFDYEYADIAAIAGKKVPACRQIALRARTKLAAREHSFGPRSCKLLVHLLAAALTSADINQVISLLTQG
jgi:RNA polymerase sigma-70 factor (ECF subfamily)